MNTTRVAAIEECAKKLARMVEGPDAGWGIYADLLRAHFPEDRDGARFRFLLDVWSDTKWEDTLPWARPECLGGEAEYGYEEKYIDASTFREHLDKKMRQYGK